MLPVHHPLLVAAALFCAAGCAGHDRAIRVDAVGLAVVSPGMSLADVHRRALSDAARNALLQADARVTGAATVGGMELDDVTLCVQSTARIERMDVRASGVVPASDPRVYRVAVRALLRPGDAVAGRLHPAGPLTVHLDVQSYLADAHLAGLVSELEDGLAACGLTVSDEGDADVWADVSLRPWPESGRGAYRAEWQCSLPSDEPGAPPAAVGEHLVAGRSAAQPGPPELAVLIAQSVIRAWLNPPDHGTPSVPAPPGADAAAAAS